MADYAASSQYAAGYTGCPMQHAGVFEQVYSNGQILKAVCRVDMFSSQAGYYSVLTSI